MLYKLNSDCGTAIEFYFNSNNFKRLVGLKGFSLPSIEYLWYSFRKAYCPTRILKYGKVGAIAGAFDDRTRFEKLCDSVNDYFYNKKQDERNGRAVWRSGFNFFDWDSGQTFTNMDDIRRHEKESGKTLISWHDREVEKAKGDRQVNKDMQKKISNKLHHVFSEVQRGRSYVKEQAEAKKEFIGSFKDAPI